MGATRSRVVVGLVVISALTLLTMAVIGIIELSTADPQPRSYVGGSSSAPVFGYRPCGKESIRSLAVSAMRGERSDLIWSIRTRVPPGPRVLTVRLGDVPVGFEQTHALPASSDWDRLAFEIVTTSGHYDGWVFDLSQIRDGEVLWAGGYAPGRNIDPIPATRFGC